MSIDVFKYLLKLKHFPIAKAAKELSRLQSLSVDEFLEWQRAQAWKIFRHHYDNNEVYRKIVGNHIPDKWEDIPIITKKDLQKPLSEMVTKGTNLKECYVSNTSGSSGHPFFFAKDRFSHAMTWAVVRNRYGMYGLNSADKQARFYGIPKEFISHTKEKVKDYVMNRRRFSVYDLSDAMMEQFLSQFKTTKFTYLYGYTNALVLFARYLINKGVVLVNVCPTIKICITTSEICTPEDHILLEKGFGVKHIREYGASETCLMGFDTPDGYWSLTEETLYVEIVNEHTRPAPFGTEGNILSTSLFNTAFPMIRYQLGDMGILSDRTNGIYRHIDKLVGRTNDTAILPSGKKAAGMTFYYISRSILEQSGVLKEFIIRQTAIDHFIFDVVAVRKLSDADIKQIKDIMDKYLEPGLRLSINQVEKIERPASGKLKHFYSELK